MNLAKADVVPTDANLLPEYQAREAALAELEAEHQTWVASFRHADIPQEVIELMARRFTFARGLPVGTGPGDSVLLTVGLPHTFIVGVRELHLVRCSLSSFRLLPAATAV